MSWQSSRIVSLYIKWTVFTFCFFANVSVKAWELDLSRRQRDIEKLRAPASVPSNNLSQPSAPQIEQSSSMWKAIVPSGLIEDLSSAALPVQDIVVIHTDDGFIPNSITMKNGVSYKFHVVNISEKNKNVSLIIDAFSEHHSIYYGKMKVFEITPRTSGIFAFISPETAQQGRMVVLGADRVPASSK